MTITFYIAANGVVENAVVTATTMPDPDLQTCLLRKLQRLRFPESDDGAIATYPLAFSLARNRDPRRHR